MTRQKNVTKLTILLNNISTYKGNRTELKNLINELNPHVVILQETRQRSKLFIDGYHEAGAVSAGMKNRGNRGSAVLVKEGLSYVTTSINDKDGVEQIGVDILLPRKLPIRITGTYVSPRHNNSNDLIRQQIIERVVSPTQIKHPSFVPGDLNCKIQTALHVTTNPMGDLLDEYKNDNRVSVHAPNEYTRYDPGNRDPSILDIILSHPRYSDMLSNLQVHHDIGSDHRPISFDIEVGSVPNQSVMLHKPDFSKADWLKYQKQFDEEMNAAPKITGGKDQIDAAAQFITNMIKKVELEAIPRITTRSGPKRRSLPAPIVAKIKEKRLLRNRLQTRNEYRLKPRINELDRQIKEAIQVYEERKRVKMWENSKDKNKYGFYKLARQFFNQKTPKPTFPIKDDQGKFITTDEGRAKEFSNLYKVIYSPPEANDQYSNLNKEAKEYSGKIKSKYSVIKPRQGHEMNTKVSPRSILKVLKKAKKTSPGPDGIYYTHIINLPESALLYLAKLYETTWNCCYFPEAWKKGITILLHKPGKNLQDPKSYRPITLLSALGKTLERLMNEELVAIMEIKEIIPESQAGFRANRSTQDKLIALTQDIIAAMREDKVAIATFHDAEKAYDKIWHEGLLLKLKNAGLAETTIALIQNYLTNREIKIRINEVLSDPISLMAGTPQGAIISPALYNCWVHDIPQPDNTRTKLSQFADDIACWSTHKSVTQCQNNLQRYNNRLMNWCEKWRMKLSPVKTKLITFHRKRLYNKKSVTQRIGQHTIKSEKETTFLGVTLDKNLNFKSHHKKIMKELQRRVKMFSGITGSQHKPRANTETSLQIFKSMIVPITTYAPTITCILTTRQFQEQDTQLRKAARLAIHAPSTVRNEYVEHTAHLLPSKSRIIQLAKNYISNPDRCASIKEMVISYTLNQNHDTKTPLDVILSA